MKQPFTWTTAVTILVTICLLVTPRVAHAVQSHDSSWVSYKKTCHYVAKRVHGKKKRLKVCRTGTPRATPTSTPPTEPTSTVAPTGTPVPNNTPTPTATETSSKISTPKVGDTFAWQTHEVNRQQTVGVFLIDLPGLPPAPSEAGVMEMVSGDGNPQTSEDSAQKFWDGYRVHYDFIAKGPYIVDSKTAADGCSAQMGPDELNYIAKLDPSANQFSEVIIVNSPQDSCKWYGQSFVYNGEVFVLVNKIYAVNTFKHELGHLNMLNHESDETLTNPHTYTLDATKSRQEYGSDQKPNKPTSVMGNALSGLNLIDQLLLGNIKDNQVTLVTRSGDYTFNRRNFGSGLQGIKIATTNQDGMYDPVKGQAPQRYIYYDFQTISGEDSLLGKTQVNAIEWDDTVRFDQYVNSFLADKSVHIDSFGAGALFQNEVDNYSVFIVNETTDSVTVHVSMG